MNAVFVNITRLASKFIFYIFLIIFSFQFESSFVAEYIFSTTMWTVGFSYIYKVFEKKLLLDDSNDAGISLVYLFALLIAFLLFICVFLLINFDIQVAQYLLYFGIGSSSSLMACVFLLKRHILNLALTELFLKVLCVFFIVYSLDVAIIFAIILSIAGFVLALKNKAKLGLHAIMEYKYSLLIALQSLLIKRADLFFAGYILSSELLVLYRYAQILSEFIFFPSANKAQIFSAKNSQKISSMCPSTQSFHLSYKKIRLDIVIFLLTIIGAFSLDLFGGQNIKVLDFLSFYFPIVIGAFIYIKIIPFQLVYSAKNMYKLIFWSGLFAFLISITTVYLLTNFFSPNFVSLTFPLTMYVVFLIYKISLKNKKNAFNYP